MTPEQALALLTDEADAATARWAEQSGGGSLCRLDADGKSLLKPLEGASVALRSAVRLARKGAAVPDAVRAALTAWEDAPMPLGADRHWQSYRDGGADALRAVLARVAG